MKTLHASSALLESGWCSNVRFAIDASGDVRSIERDCAPRASDDACDIVLPGVPNAHSHAFQRVLAGRTESASGSEDDFWTWRHAMYAAAARIGPENLLPVAEMVYAEMLEAGYTCVAEFHYLHHQVGGVPYEPRCRLADVHVAAANSAGIRLTLVPTLYTGRGFGRDDLEARQLRFGNSADDFIALVESIRRAHPTCPVGIGLHSLRAVPRNDIETILAYARDELPDAPIHIHVAEQRGEVSDSLGFSGKTPVAWLLEHCTVDARWNLVHATHAGLDELASIVDSDATVVLCPTTEANLGDGVFPFVDFARLGGRFAIGSDSQATVNPFRELQLLEYGQRLARQRRNVAATDSRRHTGAALFASCLEGGRRAVGQACGRLIEGGSADLIAINGLDPRLAEATGDALLDALVFAEPRQPIERVMVGGRWRVEGGRHVDHRRIADAFRKSLASIFHDG